MLGLILFCSFALSAPAQVRHFELGVNGLTCSACSRTVEVSLRKLPFVKDVQMNLEHTEGQIFFKDNTNIDIAKIAKAVVDAGFSVRYLRGSYAVNNLSISPGNCIEVFGNKFVFVKSADKTLNGAVTLQFIGDKYMPRKEAKQWQPLLKDNCNSAHPYFVTLLN